MVTFSNRVWLCCLLKRDGKGQQVHDAGRFALNSGHEKNLPSILAGGESTGKSKMNLFKASR